METVMRATLLHLPIEESPSKDVMLAQITYKGDAFERAKAAVTRLLTEKRYVAVGEFETDNPEKVWELTQNGVVSPSWSREPPPGVKPLGDGTVFGGYGYRSSMCGDIVVIDGNCHLAVSIGFADIGQLPLPINEYPKHTDTGPREPEAAAKSPQP
jgi:hypothetical protein